MTEADLVGMLAAIRACRICRDAPEGSVLPHEPRPVLQVSATARLAICGQAPGVRVHKSGRPFTDPSGDRLRSWLEMDTETFYNSARIAIIPMGFCFPGLDAKGGDLPPRPECRRSWHDRLFSALPRLEVLLLVGHYAHAYHLPHRRRQSLTERVQAFREILAEAHQPRLFPLPHPSWRNTAWLKKNPWFETELLPVLRKEVECLLAEDSDT